MITDFHSHILPGIDDGSASLEESIALLRLEAEQGITHVVATPHFYARHDTPEAFLQRRREAELRLREEMERHVGLPRLSVGAEVHFFPGMSSSEALLQLTIDQKWCILLEMPEVRWTESMYRELEEIRARLGLTPIIAHIDRYIGPLHTGDIPRKLEQLPVLVQANASFFRKASTRRMALKMLQKDQIHLLGSDCHNLTTRVPNLGAAVRTIEHHLGTTALERIAAYQQSVLEEM